MAGSLQRNETMTNRYIAKTLNTAGTASRIHYNVLCEASWAHFRLAAIEKTNNRFCEVARTTMEKNRGIGRLLGTVYNTCLLYTSDAADE